jgi:hypothetical protein
VVSPTTQELTHAEAQRRGGRDMNENEVGAIIDILKIIKHKTWLSSQLWNRVDEREYRKNSQWLIAMIFPVSTIVSPRLCASA